MGRKEKTGGGSTAARKPSAVILKSKTRFKEVLSGNLSREEEEEHGFSSSSSSSRRLTLSISVRLILSFSSSGRSFRRRRRRRPLGSYSPSPIYSAERAAVPYLIRTSSDWR